MPPATKDPSALYLTDPEGFPAALAALLDAAQPPPLGFANSEGEADANTKEPDDVDTDATSGVSLEDFYASLNNEQKAKFNRLGRDSARRG